MNLKVLRESISTNSKLRPLEDGAIVSIKTKDGTELKLARLNKTYSNKIYSNKTEEIYALVTLDKKKYITSVYSGGTGVGGVDFLYLQTIGTNDLGETVEFIEFV